MNAPARLLAPQTSTASPARPRSLERAAPARLVLVEDRSPPFDQVVAPAEEVDDTIVLRECMGWAALGPEGVTSPGLPWLGQRHLKQVFLLLGEEVHPHRAAVRRRSIEAVLRHAQNRFGIELVFVASNDASSELRDELMSLAEHLLLRYGSDGLSVTMRFVTDRRPRRSGIFPALRKA